MVFPTSFHRFNIVGNAHIFCSVSLPKCQWLNAFVKSVHCTKPCVYNAEIILNSFCHPIMLKNDADIIGSSLPSNLSHDGSHEQLRTSAT